MYGTEVGIFHETDHICFCSFLQAYDGTPLEAQVNICPLKGLSHRLAARREIPDEDLGFLLELTHLPKSNCARPVPPGLLYFTSPEEFLPGGFASHGQMELPPGWLLPTQCRWPSLHSHLGQMFGLAMMMVTCPHPPASLPPPHTSLPPPLAYSPPLSWVRAPWLGMGGAQEKGASIPSLARALLTSLDLRTHLLPPFSPFLGITFVLAIL